MQDLEEANGAVAPEGGPGETKVVVKLIAEVLKRETKE